MDKINVITKKPGGRPVSVWITPTLENLQAYVGGYIETVKLAKDLVIICNEEGRLLGLPTNCTICGVEFVGDIIIAGVAGEEFTHIPLPFAAMKALIPDLWREEGTV